MNYLEELLEKIISHRDGLKLTVVFVGKSGSGKSSLAKSISENFRYDAVVSHTTRPKRAEEIEGVSYHFVSEEEFAKLIEDGKMLEMTKYRDWHYGISKEEFERHDLSVVVTDPVGLRNLARLGKNVVSFYVDRDDKARFCSLINRGDNILEIALREERDRACFQDIKEYTDYTIFNNGPMEKTITTIMELIAEYAERNHLV